MGEISLRPYEKGEVLCQHGSQATALWMVLSGWVMLARHTPDGREVTVGLCTTGDIFGEAGLFPQAHYAYTPQILQSGTELVRIPSALLRRLVDEHSDLAHYLMRELGKRVATSHLQLEQMSSLSATQRLGCFLLRLCQSQKTRLPTLSIPVEKHVIASYLGMKPETLSRSFKQLGEFGVHVRGARVDVEDVGRLRDFVCESCGESGLCGTEEALYSFIPNTSA